MSFLAIAKLGLGASLLALTGCKSFHFECEANDPQVVQSVFVIVGSGAKLALEDTSELVRPARQKEYQYFAQFFPLEGQTKWKLGPNPKGVLQPEIEDNRITLTIDKAYIESVSRSVPDVQVALVAWYADGTWHCSTASLVPKGDASFSISPSGLERRF